MEKDIIKEIENMKGDYFIRNQGAESEGVYLNKIDLIAKLKDITLNNKDRLIFIGKDTWPVAGIIGKPIKTFIRRLILTRRIMRYKNWLKETGIKIEFTKPKTKAND